ncbi:MAG: SH3 domain-containing protein [Verrucomicrobiota bacterium]
MKFGFTIAVTFLTAWNLCAQTNLPAPVAESTNLAAPSQPKAPAKKKKTAKTPARKKAVMKKESTEKMPEPKALNESGIVNANAVNVRGQASFTGEVITKLNKGETVNLLEELTLDKTAKGEPAKWLKIALPTNTPVWVHTGFIDPSSKTVTPKKLQVRAGPGENYSVIGLLNKGDAVKEIRTVNAWSEIETPGGTYAFVAAELIDRNPAGTAPAVAAVPEPEPAPEVVAVPPVAGTIPDAQNPAPESPKAAEQTPPVVEPVVVPPVVEPAPVVEEPLPKRIVTREGIVRRSLNVQTPSYYELESLYNGKTINYLYNSEPGFTLNKWVGLKVTIVGEESIDARWPNTPVIEIQSIQ